MIYGLASCYAQGCIFPHRGWSSKHTTHFFFFCKDPRWLAVCEMSLSFIYSDRITISPLCLLLSLQKNNWPPCHSSRQAVVQLLGSLESGRLLRSLWRLCRHCAEETCVSPRRDGAALPSAALVSRSTHLHVSIKSQCDHEWAEKF